uniref:Uncharacterized protein n=1 Tax=Arundo donax TaxID=35708 RepID=A0A0A9CVG9_ARUDO
MKPCLVQPLPVDVGLRQRDPGRGRLRGLRSRRHGLLHGRWQIHLRERKK